MSKKHYVAIAKAIAECYHSGNTTEQARVMVLTVAEKVANVLKEDRSQFNRARFISACQVKPVKGWDVVEV